MQNENNLCLPTPNQNEHNPVFFFFLFLWNVLLIPNKGLSLIKLLLVVLQTAFCEGSRRRRPRSPNNDFTKEKRSCSSRENGRRAPKFCCEETFVGLVFFSRGSRPLSKEERLPLSSSQVYSCSKKRTEHTHTYSFWYF